MVCESLFFKLFYLVVEIGQVVLVLADTELPELLFSQLFCNVGGDTAGVF